jgi:hypothetical protein
VAAARGSFRTIPASAETTNTQRFEADSLANRFIRLDALAPADAFDDFKFLITAVMWNQDRDRLADKLFGGIAKQALRSGVRSGDNTIEVFAYDRIVGGLDNRR